MTFKKLKRVFDKWLYLEDEPDFLRVLFGTVIANRLDTTPTWLMVIGNASSGKSEILGAMKDSKEIHMLSLLTPNALISGMDKQKTGGKDASLLPHLNGKTAIIRDASTLLSLHPNARGYIFSQLRTAFDGNEPVFYVLPLGR